MQIVCDNIDRAVSLELRPRGLPRGTIRRLYEAARADGQPISLTIAQALLALVPSRPAVGIFTGVWDPEHFPMGESDGPPGAAALGWCLEKLGARVIFPVEKEIIPVMRRLGEVLGMKTECFALSRVDARENAWLADELHVAVFIEKLGSSRKGIFHLATGSARESKDGLVAEVVEKMNQAGKLTIGTGDGGNEVGFGKIFEQAREIVPMGKVCKCPERDGIVTGIATRYLLPAATSNWGAYGMMAGLALLSGDLSVLHRAEVEVQLIAVCREMNCVDGGLGVVRDYVDGIPARTNAAFVDILATMVRNYTEAPARKF